MPCYQQALQIVSNPHPNHSQSLRQLSWAIVKTARGQKVRISTLPKAEKANGQ